METHRGICTSCGMAVQLPHTCDPDRLFLGSTDWEVRRYKDQIELGVPTTLTEKQYGQLQADRQAARERISPTIQDAVIVEPEA